MTINLLLIAIIIIACVICNKISNKIGMPMLLAFILLGMFFGSDGIIKISFDNYSFAEQVCSIALIFVMFYGGFGTKWSEAKPIAPQAIILSSFGTLITAGIIAFFCYLVLKISLLESFLIGSVISSTDAASVFSILRSKHLNLRYNTASLLEIESGSNDPFSYMLTIIALSLINGNMSNGQLAYMIFSQITYGIIFGLGIALLTLLFLKKFHISSSGFSSVFIVGIAIIAYAAPASLGGNGYLSTYITGIVLGNCRLNNKQELVHFFDGTTGLMQMLLFFLLGLLSFPSQLPKVTATAICIALFLTFIARPITVFMLLAPFKSNTQQKLLVSWSGMRGAASIVFAINTVTNPVSTDNDIFHIVFFIVLFSILVQGTLIPFMAKKLHMTDNESDVMKTFNDYIEEVPVQFIQFAIPTWHPWIGKKIKEILLPPDSLFVLLTRENEKIIPNGETTLYAKDTLILGGNSINKSDNIQLYEKKIEEGNEWLGKSISNINLGQDLIIIIKREKVVVIPKGNTILKENDILVITNKKNLI